MCVLQHLFGAEHFFYYLCAVFVVQNSRIESNTTDMKNLSSLILAALFCCATTLSAANYCASAAWGNANNVKTVTGGGSATPVLVSSVSELKSAIGSKAKNKVVIITKSLTFTSMLTAQDGANVTILGLPGVTLTSLQQDASSSGILYVKRFDNLIIRNLTFIGPGAYDCDGNDLLCFEKVTNAWVDHCDFQDGCDGNFDNKSTTDNVTVSWCRFRYLKKPKEGGSGGADDHRFTNLLGSSSSDKPSDGTYNFTWAYCWWDEGCRERMVRCRNCELHFLNCYWNSSVANYYVGPENAKCYFEGCTFAGKANSAKNIFKSYGGTNACKFVNCAGNLPSNSGSVSAPTYSYDKLSAADAKTMVTNSSCGAGATLTINTKGEIGSSCDGGGTPDPDPITPDPVDPDTTDTPDPVTSDLTWNFSKDEFTTLTGDITETKVIKGLTLVATSEKKMTEAANSAAVKIGELSFSHVLKTGGTGNANYRNLNFAVSGACTIDVYLLSAKSTEERTLNIYSGTYGGTLLTTMPATGTAAKQSYNYTGGATTIYMGSANSGINFYAINLIYSGGDEPPTPPTPVYTLTYDENGGSGEMESQSAEEGQSVTVKANTFTAPTGYTFQEWNDNYKGSGTKYTAGQNVTLTSDLTLFAVWSPLTYTVTLDATGGNGGTESITATFDDAMPNITIPIRDGYTFTGYFTEQNGVGTQYYDANGSSTNSWIIPQNSTLYAAWKEQSVTPVEDGDLHFWFFNATDAATNGLTNDADFFSGMISSGSQMAGSITIDGKSYTITRRTGDNAKFGNFTIPESKKGIFYALAVSSGGGDRQINLINGSIKYELSVPGGTDSYKRLESEVLPAGTYSIEREGSSNVRLGIVVVKTIDDGGEEPPTPPTPAIYTVTWDENGGTCSTITTTVEENTAVGTLPEAEKENCTFDGWFTELEGGEQISAETIITKDTTFYAHYTENPEPPTPPTPSGSSTWWNISDDDFKGLGIISSDTVVRDLHIVAVPDTTIEIDGNEKTMDGYSFTHRLKLGGTGKARCRHLWFNVTGNCSVDIYLMSSKKNNTRYLNVATGTFGNVVTELSAGDGNAITKGTYSYTGEATRIYLYSKESGINIYGIKLTYPSTPTDIENVQNESVAHKVLRNGQVLILREGKTYTILGARVY